MTAGQVSKGLFFIVLGAILLGNTLGYVDWSIWRSVLTLWPILLVGLGLSIVTRKRLFMPLALIVMVIWAALAPSPSPQWFFGHSRSNLHFETHVPVLTERAAIGMEMGAATLRVRSGAQGLMEASADYWGTTPHVEQDTSDGVSRITLSHLKGGGSWDIRLNNEVLQDIQIKVGASKAEVDLRDLLVSSLDLETGASSLDITFGERQEYTVANIDAGASSVSLQVPSTLGVRLRIDGALTSHNLDEEGFVKRGESWVTPEYDGAIKRLDIHVDSGLTSLTIHKY